MSFWGGFSIRTVKRIAKTMYTCVLGVYWGGEKTGKQKILETSTSSTYKYMRCVRKKEEGIRKTEKIESTERRRKKKKTDLRLVALSLFCFFRC